MTATTITFGKIEGSVNDGAKSIDIKADGVVIGMIEVCYSAENIGATRRKVHIPDYVEAYVIAPGIDFSVPTIPVVGGNEGVTAAVRAAKNAILARVTA